MIDQAIRCPSMLIHNNQLCLGQAAGLIRACSGDDSIRRVGRCFNPCLGRPILRTIDHSRRQTAG